MEMEKSTEKRRWRLNLFDVIFIVCALIVAAVILVYSSRSGSGIIAPTGAQETVLYTMEFRKMLPGTAELIKPGDTLVDKTERKPMGTVVSVTLQPSRFSEKNFITGDRVMSEIPDRTDAIVVVAGQATVTERNINVGGFMIRAGAKISVNGPLYNGSGFIIDIERGDD